MENLRLIPQQTIRRSRLRKPTLLRNENPRVGSVACPCVLSASRETLAAKRSRGQRLAGRRSVQGLKYPPFKNNQPGPAAGHGFRLSRARVPSMVRPWHAAGHSARRTARGPLSAHDSPAHASPAAPRDAPPFQHRTITPKTQVPKTQSVARRLPSTSRRAPITARPAPLRGVPNKGAPQSPGGQPGGGARPPAPARAPPGGPPEPRAGDSPCLCTRACARRPPSPW